MTSRGAGNFARQRTLIYMVFTSHLRPPRRALRQAWVNLIEAGEVAVRAPLLAALRHRVAWLTGRFD